MTDQNFPFTLDLTKPIEFNFDGTIESMPWLPSASHPSKRELMNVCYVDYTGTHLGQVVKIKLTPGDMFSASIRVEGRKWLSKIAQFFTYSEYDPIVQWASDLHDKGFKEKVYSLEVLNAMYNDICRAAAQGKDKRERTLMRKGLDWLSPFAFNRGKK